MHKKVKNESISHFYYLYLDDWEILSAISYCNNVFNKKTTAHRDEFVDICFFFFDGNEKAATDSLKQVIDLYKEEYSKRHAN